MKKSKELLLHKGILIGIGVLLIYGIAVATIGGSFWDKVAQYTADRVEIPVLSEEPLIGALTSPDIQSLYLSVNGIRDNFFRVPLIQGSSTICSAVSPVGTSTLIYGVISIKTSTTTIAYYDIARATNNNTATTTTLGSTQNVVANGYTVIVASTSPATANLLIPGSVIGGSQYYVNVKGSFGDSSGTTAPNMAPVGYCQFVFREID